MNLELNLEEKVLKNPNIAQFTKDTVFIEGDVVVIHYLGGSHHHDGSTSKRLMSASKLYDFVDAEDFAYETGMRDIVELKEYVELVNNQYKHLFTEEEPFTIGVTKNYSYSRGTYDTIKTIINKINRHQQRPAGMNSIFKRIADNQWAYNNFRDKMNRLEAMRFKAKEASGNIVDNISDLIQSQTQRFDTIIESTEMANQMTDNFEIINCIDMDIDSRLESNAHTSISLYTIVKCKAKEMTIVNSANDEICKMMVPEANLYFKRPLFKALTSDRNFISDFSGSALGGYHPYINSYPFYSYTNDILGHNAWGSLCLSSYQDDVLYSLSKNDYMSFVMGLMNWNNIYNKDHTNPYSSITKVMSSTHFPIIDEVKASRVKTSIGFDKTSCFSLKHNTHRTTEIDPDQRERNDNISMNLYPYAPYIISECDEKKCPLRNECYGYQNIAQLEDSIYPEVLEDIVGNLYGNGGDTYTYDYQYFYGQLIRCDNAEDYLHSIIHNRYKDSYDYWGNKERELTEQEIALAAMQNQIAQWEQEQAATGGVHE